METLERLIRGTVRLVGPLGDLISRPKMLLFVAIGLILLAYRHNNRADEIRQWHKDPATVVGLFSVRLAWWWRAPVAGLVVVWWLAGRGLGWVAALAVAALVTVRVASPSTWAVLAGPERAHQWRQRWAWRWLWAAFQSDVLGRERWGLKSPYPTVRAAELRGENVALTVKVPPKMDVTALARHEGAVGAQLKVKGLRVLPHPAHLGLARVEILNRTLAPGRRLDSLDAPVDERLLTVGYGFDGPVHFDVDNDIGLGIFGGSGAGKGVLARWVAAQALDARHGREVWLIDPQASGEWSPFDGIPGVRRLCFDPADPVVSLQAIDEALDELAVDVTERNRACAAAGVDSWRWLPADVKARWPRRLLVTDEVSALLAKVERSDPTRPLRESIGAKLGSAYRTVRKGGVAFVHIDQASYQGDQTYLAAGAVAQLGRWVALGGMRDETRRMISGTADWPYVQPINGLGLTGRRADEHPEPIEIPLVDRAQVEHALAARRAGLEDRVG